jgi:hypothetical protein
MHYVFQTEEAANAALAAIKVFLPVVGLKNGKPAPESAQTTDWMTEPTLMLSGEFAVNRVPNERLDNAGPLEEVDGVWKHAGIPMQVRIDFMAEHGQDSRELTEDDFPTIREVAT